MFRSYLKIALRNLSRNRRFSAINISGLAAGLTVCLLITLYILDELSYDKHQQDNIYRVAYKTARDEPWACEPAPAAFTLKAEMPEVLQATRLLKFPNMDKVLLQYETASQKKSFFETNGYYVDSTFFQIFNYDFRYGSTNSALDAPNSLVISESISRKLFGDTDPTGKPIQVSLPFGNFTYTISGVFKENHPSHIPAHFFLSMRNHDVGGWVENQTSWATNNIFHTYIRLRPGTDTKAFEQRLTTEITRHEGAQLKAAGLSRTHFLQPMKGIYLRSNIGNEIGPTGNIKFLYIMGSLAIFVLCIACINFMNLSTARSEKRAREVGVRKVIGAGRRSLIGQFLGESFLLCTIALIIALCATQLTLPIFNTLTQKDLHLSQSPQLIYTISALAILTGALSGLYPAFYLSSFRPISVLKGRIVNSWSAIALRKGLVIFQFTISVSLILGAIVIGSQLQYLRSKDLGFKKEQQLVIPVTSGEVAGRYAALKDQLSAIPAVRSVTSGSSYPGIQNVTDFLGYGEGQTSATPTDIMTIAAEDDYFKTLGISIVYGRTFMKGSKVDSASMILNETAARNLGYTPATAIGRKINYEFQGVRRALSIIGVVKDFNFESLHTSIKALGFSSGDFFANKHNYTIINLAIANYPQTLSAIEQAWNRVNPNAPFEFSFLDQDFQKNYDREERAAHIVIYATGVAIAIACLGLFGLAAFSAEQRTREIGIRKVLGASVSSITLLLSKDFVRLTGIAIGIATPIAWFAMHKWLQNFAYRITVSWWMLLVAGSLAVVIALITVSFTSIRTALSNPTKSLRSE